MRQASRDPIFPDLLVHTLNLQREGQLRLRTFAQQPRRPAVNLDDAVLMSDRWRPIMAEI